MEWFKYSEKQPQINKLVIFWRYKKKCYLVGKLESNILKNYYVAKPEQKEVVIFWRSSSSNNLLNIDPNDHWSYITPLTFAETFE